MSRASWVQLWAVVRPLLELKAEGKPDSNSWVWARCIDASNHKNSDAHFSMRINTKSGGVRCMAHDCPVGPNLNQLAERLGLRISKQEGRPSAADAMLRLAGERMLSEQALCDTYGVHTVKGGWAFPVDDPDADGHPHIKRFSWWPGEPRFWWPKGSGVVAKDLVYGLSHIDEGTEGVYVAAGEIDCVTLLEAGYDAISFLAGEGAEPSDKAIQKLLAKGVQALWLVYDADEAGEEGAKRVAEFCVQHGLHIRIVSLPADLGPGGDINDLWRRCEGDRDRFVEALKAYPSFSYSPVSLGSEESRRILRTFAEFIEATELAADTEYLVEGLFPSDWLLGVAGKPRVGKSLLALHLARCVATGEPFLGRLTKQGPVVYLALEDPPTLVLERLKSLGEAPDAYVYVGLWSDEVRASLELDLQSIRPALIIIDPLVATYGARIQDEADNAAIAAHMAALHQLGQAVSASVLVIHHQRKAEGSPGDTVRGGTAIFAAVHCMVVATGEPERLKLTFLTKTAPVDPIEVTLGEGLSWSVAGHAPAKITTGDQIVFALRELKTPSSAEELAKFLGIPRSTVNAWLTKLKADSRVVEVEKRDKTPYYGEKSHREMVVPLSRLAPGGIHQDSGGVD